MRRLTARRREIALPLLKSYLIGGKELIFFDSEIQYLETKYELVGDKIVRFVFHEGEWIKHEVITAQSAVDRLRAQRNRCLERAGLIESTLRRHFNVSDYKLDAQGSALVYMGRDQAGILAKIG